jgi:hypothetical protein
MKKFLLIASCFLICYNTNAQEFPADLGDNPRYNDHSQVPTFLHNLSDPAYKIAIGVQYSYPVYTLSFKYAITDASVIQALVSPFSATYGYYNYSFYGLRYIYRFPFDNFSFYGPFTASYPYLFAGGGLLSFNYPVYEGGAYAHTTSNTAFGYSIGAGYEIIISRHLGISAELGFGAMTANGSSAVSGLTGSGGIHYYISCHRHHAVIGENEPAEEANPNDQDQPAATEDQPADDQPVKKSRRQRTRRDNDED